MNTHIPSSTFLVCGLLLTGLLFTACEVAPPIETNGTNGDEALQIAGTIAIGARVQNADVVAACGTGTSLARVSGRSGSDGSYSLTIREADAIDTCRSSGVRVQAHFRLDGVEHTLLSGQPPAKVQAGAPLMVHVTPISDIAVRQSADDEALDWIATPPDTVEWPEINANVRVLADAMGIGAESDPVEDYDENIDNRLEVFVLTVTDSGIMLDVKNPGESTDPEPVMIAVSGGAIQDVDPADATAHQMLLADLTARIEGLGLNDFADRSRPSSLPPQSLPPQSLPPQNLPPQNLPPQTAGHTISGAILMGGSGLAGVTVSLQGSQISATTDQSGAYSLSGVTTGRHTVTTELTGYYVYPADYSRHISVAADRAGFDFIAHRISGAIQTIDAIQGAGHTSSLDAIAVGNIIGVVTAVGDELFFMQSVDPDDDDATSAGLQVYLGSTPSVAVGDIISVSGTVDEFRSSSAARANDLTVTQIGPSPAPTIVGLSAGNALPAPVILGSAGRRPPTSIISSGAINGPFNPDSEGIDFYESLEGMRVRINRPQIVSGFLGFGEVSVVGDDGNYATTLTPSGGILLREGDSNPEVIQVDTDFFLSPLPRANTGDFFLRPIVGIMHYTFGRPKVVVTETLPFRFNGSLVREATSLVGASNKLSIASFNVENLAFTSDAAKFADIADTIVDGLNAPDIIALQEIQDDNGLTNNGVVSAAETIDRLVDEILAANGPRYVWRQIDPENNQDGGAPGGNIRVVFLYNPVRVTFNDAGTPSATTAVTVSGTTIPTITPNPGRILGTGFTAAGGNGFSNSRKPIIGQFTFNGHRLFVVNAHFNSKGGDGNLWGMAQPPVLSTETQRRAQAEHVKAVIDQILTIDDSANIIVLGDLNDFAYSSSIQALLATNPALRNLTDDVPANQRYTLQFAGNSQQLDHILISQELSSRFPQVDIVHRYSEYFATERHSDHDPIVATFVLIGSDTRAPFWSSSPSLVGTPGEASFEFEFETDEGSTLFYTVTDGAAPAPSPQQIAQGHDGSDDPALVSGFLEGVVADVTTRVSVESNELRPGSEYNVYATLVDDSGNLPRQRQAFDVMTGAAILPDISAGPTVGTVGPDSFEFTATVSKSGMLYYGVYQGAAMPTDLSDLMGGSGAVASGSVAVSADVEATVNVSGLQAGTAYSLYVAAVDQLESASAISDAQSVTTAAAR